MPAIPDRWLEYSPYGRVIPGTNIIPFKTPLSESVFDNRPSIIDRWSPREVMSAIPRLGFIIDLSYAQRPRYPIIDFERNGINYVQLKCAGREIPNEQVVNAFADIVMHFRRQHDNRLIGIHCTHGVNRTGYVVCRYLIDCLNIDPGPALFEFGRARGYDIERENYKEDLFRPRRRRGVAF